mgnify:CR=1
TYVFLIVLENFVKIKDAKNLIKGMPNENTNYA